MALPRGKDVWKIMTSSNETWIMKSHSAMRWQPHNPLKGHLPCVPAEELTNERVQVRFDPEGRRTVVFDSWLDPAPRNRQDRRHGYTLYRMKNRDEPHPGTASYVAETLVEGPRGGYLRPPKTDVHVGRHYSIHGPSCLSHQGDIAAALGQARSGGA